MLFCRGSLWTFQPPPSHHTATWVLCILWIPRISQTRWSASAEVQSFSLGLCVTHWGLRTRYRVHASESLQLLDTFWDKVFGEKAQQISSVNLRSQHIYRAVYLLGAPPVGEGQFSTSFLHFTQYSSVLQFKSSSDLNTILIYHLPLSVYLVQSAACKPPLLESPTSSTMFLISACNLPTVCMKLPYRT